MHRLAEILVEVAVRELRDCNDERAARAMDDALNAASDQGAQRAKDTTSPT